MLDHGYPWTANIRSMTMQMPLRGAYQGEILVALFPPQVAEAVKEKDGAGCESRDSRGLPFFQQRSTRTQGSQDPCSAMRRANHITVIPLSRLHGLLYHSQCLSANITCPRGEGLTKVQSSDPTCSFPHPTVTSQSHWQR